MHQPPRKFENPSTPTGQQVSCLVTIHESGERPTNGTVSYPVVRTGTKWYGEENPDFGKARRKDPSSLFARVLDSHSPDRWAGFTVGERLIHLEKAVEKELESWRTKGNGHTPKNPRAGAKYSKQPRASIVCSHARTKGLAEFCGGKPCRL